MIVEIEIACCTETSTELTKAAAWERRGEARRVGSFKRAARSPSTIGGPPPAARGEGEGHPRPTA